MAGVAGRVLLIFKGAYDETVTYQPLDVASYSGTSYVCKKTALNKIPTNTEYWQVLAQSGAFSITGTLVAGESTVVFENALILDTSTVKVYTSVPGLLYTNIVKGTNKITLTFPVQSQNVEVKLDII